jgi:hypothetical protein
MCVKLSRSVTQARLEKAKLFTLDVPATTQQ